MIFLCGCFAGLCSGVRAQDTAQSTPGAGTVETLFVSDIHFEPFWDPGKAARLKAAPVGEWSAILAAPEAADREARFAKLQQTCKARSVDTPYALYASSVRAMRDDASGAKFVVLSGDLLAHDFNCKFETLFPKATPGEHRAFAEKTIGYVMRQLRGALPGVPVFAALGNNDSDCGDYRMDANSEFLRESGRALAGDVPARERAVALRTFAEGGFYSVRLPAPIAHTRMLVLDDIFMSRRYTTCTGKADPAPAAAQIVWLEQQLDAARRSHEKVWVMAHIPPGVDPYSTAMRALDLCAGGKPQMYLSSEALPEAMAGYGDVIELAIFAHTHMDEMRLLKPAAMGAPPEGVAIKVVPSISPINGNKPAFMVARIDAATAQTQGLSDFCGVEPDGPECQRRRECRREFRRECRREVDRGVRLCADLQGAGVHCCDGCGFDRGIQGRSHGADQREPELHSGFQRGRRAEGSGDVLAAVYLRAQERRSGCIQGVRVRKTGSRE